MRIILSCALIAGALFVSTGSAQTLPPVTTPAGHESKATSTNPPTQRLRLDEAWTFAEAAHPELRSKQAQLDAVQGALIDSGALLYNNPTMSLDKTRRQVPSVTSSEDKQREWTVGVSQSFEIAGQQGYRQEAAEAGMSALRTEIEDTRRQIRTEVSQRFYKLLALQKRAHIEAQALGLFEATASAMQKRRLAGENTRLDANVALVEAERARNQLAQVQEQLAEARSELSASLQLPADIQPEASGDFSLQAKPFTLDALLVSMQSQPRLRALEAHVNAASSRLKLERASVYPDLTVGLNVGREGADDAREKVTTLSVSFPLPLFRRNASGIGQASSELTQARIAQQTAQRDAAAQVRGLWLKLQSMEARMTRLQDSVLPALEGNQALAGKSQREGEIGLLEMIVVSRQTLDARRDLLDAQSDYFTTRAALEQAAGWIQQ